MYRWLNAENHVFEQWIICLESCIVNVNHILPAKQNDQQAFEVIFSHLLLQESVTDQQLGSLSHTCDLA
jgi:hypothetical protein